MLDAVRLTRYRACAASRHDAFWKAHLRTAPEFPPLCQEFLNRIFVVDPSKRASVDELWDHEWLQGPVYTPEQVCGRATRLNTIGPTIGPTITLPTPFITLPPSRCAERFLRTQRSSHRVHPPVIFVAWLSIITPPPPPLFFFCWITQMTMEMAARGASRATAKAAEAAAAHAAKAAKLAAAGGGAFDPMAASTYRSVDASAPGEQAAGEQDAMGAVTFYAHDGASPAQLLAAVKAGLAGVPGASFKESSGGKQRLTVTLAAPEAAAPAAGATAEAAEDFDLLPPVDVGLGGGRCAGLVVEAAVAEAAPGLLRLDLKRLGGDALTFKALARGPVAASLAGMVDASGTDGAESKQAAAVDADASGDVF